ncbi:MAG: NAD(+)/NADH kinase [Melioribacteraceae bacterium]|nr:NAD(+)/NADH kinase [Melioribacteraceae bacterium]
MKFGIIANILKKDIALILLQIIEEISKQNYDFVLSNDVYENIYESIKHKTNIKHIDKNKITENCDILISIGGDGTMLNAAYLVRNTGIPILGVNYGKLGFLAEFDLQSLKMFLNEVKDKKYIVEDRICLTAKSEESNEEMFAINDFVIDKGPWQKMIELEIFVDDEYVTSFMADGIIVATPTGTTGYSLSTGGPIVNPKADVITLSPIAPHTLTMRPLVISSKQKIKIIAHSPFDKIQVSSDGQRVNYFKPPTKIFIEKSKNPIKLVHLSKSNYYEILRSKLYWGIDIRKSN